ncbi:toxin-activating lysine-acyltransferase [Cupriavidus oxalaticus]|jgi:cytolysin-activating lysine-acyltransferase|uniref:RTX toxin-activating lysine-acyltransferase n=1 Tax=Cupriavidus oxalaticus TaxID=96344 RepID=A0A375GNQ7_9BURK|nr:toxin-activating lysine-acyltransferase [Cupriavidus oxalaticus]QEZ42870.1 toxin-activating lysine-acyltransferase [Cupriavidus oxalaticus]QRQ83525.1 toxin-activating lysine-acyltransferase [Cupriavidus oxalaticus]QRQ92386.1 toxin-activating lysine-acyltransferase [Cupriavidus oxalaticus]WQD87003.1 toxin-activating lysine-acyltransferase [Cupriavidus oxalaticus]SPC24632.1 RTX toxin activating acyltransferase [Cupriavidus oxalaticus]
MTTPTNTEQLARFAAEQAQRVIKKIPLLGPVSWLMMNNPSTRHAFFADLEWRVMPPLVLEQAKLYMKGEMPTAFVTWACLSEAVIERYMRPPFHLAPGDWKSGDQVFLIDLIAPYGGASEVLADLRQTALAGRVIHQVAPETSSSATVITV